MSMVIIVLSIASGSGDNVSLALPEKTLHFDSICPEKCEGAKANPNFDFDVCSDSRFVPLREFVSTVPSPPPDFFYTSVWTPEGCKQACYTYSHLGEVARVAKSPINGTVALLRYHNGKNNRFSTKHLSAEWPPVSNRDYLQTYVFSEPKEGTFGLYGFHKGHIQRLALDYNIKALENMGWVKEDLLGYVFRPCPSPLLGVS